MTERIRYNGRRYFTGTSILSASRMAFLIFILFGFFSIKPLNGQDDPLYDQIAVYLRVPYIGMSEIDALIKDEDAWLPVTDLFNYLKIRNTSSEDLRIISGFFIDPAAEYVIDRTANSITYEGRTWQLNEGDIIMTETGLFLKAVYFGRVFGVNCTFSFRDLTVSIETKLELPGIREIRIAEMRRNINRLGGEIQVDTTIGRSYPGFRFGMADWSVYATQQPGVGSQARLNLALGAVIAGGEATASFNYNSDQPFSAKQQTYLWRYVNNDSPWLRQVSAGKINTRATSTIYNHVIGVNLTNTPTTFRRSYGTYTLTDRTEPEWTVELYVNSVLVDYVKADASGFFTFEVPLVYGNTSIRLKFYGPWGEEREREQNITIPYNFLPEKELEYSVSAGVVEDSLFSRFSRADISYGATRFLTIGGGAEYLSSIPTRPFMPFVDASVRLTNNLLLSGVYTYRVKAAGALSYRFPANIQLDMNYAWYHRDQQAINFNFYEERKASLSVPFRVKNIGAFTRISYYRLALATSAYTTAEWLISGSFRKLSANLTSYSLFLADREPNIYSNLSLSIRLPAEILLSPQIQYSFTGRQIISARAGLERKVFKNGYATLAYEQNFSNKLKMGEVGIRYDFSFAQTGASARRTNGQSTFVEYARGSIINDRSTNFVRADNRTNVGRSGLTVLAFLDINANGIRDEGEQKVSGLRVKSNGGTVGTIDKDTTIRILGLEPYVKYFIELDDDGFENISWSVGKKSIAVIADPNILKLVEVPVKVMGEAAGTVSLEDKGVVHGLGRIIVTFRNRLTGGSYNILTEPDGYFSYFGLAPGKYQVRTDTAQLRRLGLVSEPDSIVFSIMGNTEGDYIEGLDFTLHKAGLTPEAVTLPDSAAVAEIKEISGMAAGSDTLKITPPVPAVKVEKDTSYLVVHEVTRELVTITEDYFAVQFGAFRTKLYAEIMKREVEGVLDKNVELFEEDGFWKVRITGFKDREDLEKYIPVIQGQGITEIWVITNKAVKGEWITMTKEDSLAVVKETVTEESLPVVIAGTTVQLGAFSTLEETVSMSDRLLAAAEKLVTIRNEGGLYKVQITGFEDTSEVRNFLPLLKKHGFDDITILHESGTGLVPVVPAVEAPVAEQAAGEQPVAVQPVQDEQPEIIPEEPEKVKEVSPTPPPVPRFVLHAGSYYKKSEAERARLRIERRLRLPVEILEEWDTYRVIITGFFTREETYPYYPELAGLGFTDIFVYEKPLTER